MGWTGSPALAPDGSRVGVVAGVLVDRQSGRPQWLLLHHRSHGHRCVPLAGIQAGRDRVHLPHDASVVHRSVPVPHEGSLTARHERQLCASYRLPSTSGALRSSWERRRTSSLARVGDDGVVRWEPPPRYPNDRGVLTAGPGAAAAATARRPLRVLIVDADGAAGQARRAAIDHHPRLTLHSVHRDGPQALAAAVGSGPPDVAVLGAVLTLLPANDVLRRLHAALPQLVSVVLDEGITDEVHTLDGRTVRAPATIAMTQLLYLIEVLAMTQPSRDAPAPV